MDNIHQHRPLLFRTMGPDLVLSGSMAGISPWPQAAVQATHMRQFVTTFTSPDLAHFIINKTFHLSLTHLSITNLFIVVAPS